MPTAWGPDDEVDLCYALLDLLLDESENMNFATLLAGDFNANLGAPAPGDSIERLGQHGSGQRNARGWTLARWVERRGLNAVNRMHGPEPDHDRWTCCRTMDGSLVQIDFVLAQPLFERLTTWNDFGVPVGLDHRCVHAVVQIKVPRSKASRRHVELKNWTPHLNGNGCPEIFHNKLKDSMAQTDVHSFTDIEMWLHDAGVAGGSVTANSSRFRASKLLTDLRQHRRMEPCQWSRKHLSFRIRKLQRAEVRQWKARHLNTCLHHTSRWKFLRRCLPRSQAQNMVPQPLVTDFAEMLEQLFCGNPSPVVKPDVLDERPWTIEELQVAIKRMKCKRGADEAGLVAELLKHALQELLVELHLYNDILSCGNVPSEWSKTVFIMLAKKVKATHAADFRPIAIVRLLYKVFAYLVLRRIEDCLEQQQPQEQHGFRTGYRIEEHLVSANLFLDKAAAHDMPVWVVSLDLSKAFDRVSWPSLWQALANHGVSAHLIWILQSLYDNQFGEVLGDWNRSRAFMIGAGVRQGCVLSPRLFCSVLQMAMASWRAENPSGGFDLGDGRRALLDLRFADDILLFAKSSSELASLLDSLILSFSRVGLQLSALTTIVLTTEAQPPQMLRTDGGITLKVLDRDAGHKWLGCVLSAQGSTGQNQDIRLHLQQANKAFFANRWILCNKHVSISARLHFFQSVVGSVACFGAGHRTVHNQDMQMIKAEYRKLLRTIVGPPGGMSWDQEWHEILHCWNVRAQRFADSSGIVAWPTLCLRQHWLLGGYVARLPDDRWARRILDWRPPGRRKLGRPTHTWESKFEEFCRACDLGDWKPVAADAAFWKNMTDDFVGYCLNR